MTISRVVFAARPALAGAGGALASAPLERLFPSTFALGDDPRVPGGLAAHAGQLPFAG